MRILRKHDAEIEKFAGYACMKCMQDGLPCETVEQAHRLYNEVFTNFTWLGGYSVIFTTDEGDVLCAECAKRRFIMDREDVTSDIYYEGPTMYCDECNREIESSYGDPDVEKEEERVIYPGTQTKIVWEEEG